MKTLIIGLNSKFVHASLAPWYLKSYCADLGTIKVLEYTINDSLDLILASIYKEGADVIAFSCYIWNIDYVLKLITSLKKLDHKVKIIIGGPEVSYDCDTMMKDNPEVDFVVAGEGEESFRLLLGYLTMDSGISTNILSHVGGLTYRVNGDIVTNPINGFIESLDTIPSPYTPEMLAASENKIIYYESSRGCPFSCSYCLSSTFQGVRYFSMERIKRDLALIMQGNVRQIKFVDRTFNCHKNRAKEILEFIISSSEESDKDINFHFEVAADLFDDDMLDILEKAPHGLIQFEIGIQTTNMNTLEAIDRKTSLDIAFDNIGKLQKLGRFHLHMDLIAGLPGEDFESFRSSFNAVYSLKPHQLQLGFLKMLKGSKIRRDAGLYGYEYRQYPPYEVLYNDCISYDEIIELKEIEEVLERYYNSSRFQKTLAFIQDRFYTAPFDFYSEFAKFCSGRGYLKRFLSGREQYTVLLEFLEENYGGELNVLNELLKFDYLVNDRSNNLPKGMKRNIIPGFKEKCFEFLKDSKHIELYLPKYHGIPAKQIYKDVHFEVFEVDVTMVGDMKAEKNIVVLFDYMSRNKVSGSFEHMKVDFEAVDKNSP